MLTPAVLEAFAQGAAAPRSEFAYVDESGNTGSVAKGGTRTYTLGCVLVPFDAWTERLDYLSAVRRGIRDTYGVRLRDELKANYLLKARGSLVGLGLGDGQRRDIYQRLLRSLNVVASGTFAIVIDKEQPGLGDRDPADVAWEYLMQRLRIRSTNGGHPIVLVHDDGDRDRVRKIHRRFRRHSWAPGGKAVTAPLLVEDPVARDSALSYFVQAADLAAYAAFRRYAPPGRSTGKVCNERMWDEVRPSWRTEVSSRRQDAIVAWPN